MTRVSPVSGRHQGAAARREEFIYPALADVALAALLSSNDQRVDPAEAWEACEIGIGGVDLQTVLDRQRSQVRIHHEVAGNTGNRKDRIENLAVTFARLRCPGSGRGEPGSHLRARDLRARRSLHHAWIGNDAQKGEKARPWQSDPRRIVEAAVKPPASGGMLGTIGVERVDQDVGVDQNHLKASCSAIARTSAILSRLPIRDPPRDTGLVQAFARGRGFSSNARSPSRRASFTTSLKRASRR